MVKILLLPLFFLLVLVSTQDMTNEDRIFKISHELNTGDEAQQVEPTKRPIVDCDYFSEATTSDEIREWDCDYHTASNGVMKPTTLGRGEL